MVPSSLVVSAIATVEGYARLQCWQLANFTAISLAGGLSTYSLNLGSFDNTTFSVIPPRLVATTHNAPKLQFVMFLAGLAQVVTQNSTYGPAQQAFFIGGPNSLLIAADTTGVGHITNYPSDAQTWRMEIPFKDGVVPGHTVLYDGACNGTSIVEMD